MSMASVMLCGSILLNLILARRLQILRRRQAFYERMCDLADEAKGTE